jgi:DNA-directed RNA polymerase sigma subunit (sigma70/sigma32)
VSPQPESHADVDELAAEALKRTGAVNLQALAESESLVQLEPAHREVLELRLGLDRQPMSPRTRREVAREMGPEASEASVAQLERKAIDALVPPVEV